MLRTLQRIARALSPLAVYAPLWAAWALLLLLFPAAAAHAQEAAPAVAAAGRFTTLMNGVLLAVAGGIGAASLIIGGLGTAFGSAKMASVLRPGLAIAVVMGLASRVLDFLTKNGTYLLG